MFALPHEGWVGMFGQRARWEVALRRGIAVKRQSEGKRRNARRTGHNNGGGGEIKDYPEVTQREHAK